MPSRAIHAFYRGERIYVVPAVCVKQDIANDLFITRWEGIFPGMIPSIHSITLHEDHGNNISQHSSNMSWMITDPSDFEPATKQNLGRDDRLKVLFEVLNTLGIHLQSLRSEHILVRKHLADSPFTHTPRPSNAPPEAVPYHKNIVLLAGWHRISQRMHSAQLAETREKFMLSLPDEPPPALEPSTKQPDGFWYCQEYHPGRGKICNATFYNAANLREHLVEVHEAPREKLDKEVEAVQVIKNGRTVDETGVSRLGRESGGHEISEDIHGQGSVASQPEDEVSASDEEAHEVLPRTGLRVRWAGDEVLERYQRSDDGD